MKNNTQYLPSTRTEKIIRWILIVFDVLIILSGIGLAVYYKIIGDPDNRFLASLSLLGFGVLPYIFELIMRSKIPNSVFLLFNVYLVIAGLWGAALNGYYNFSWLDIVVHILMGYLMCALALFVLVRTGQNKKMHFITVACFCVFFSLFVECVWEISEWTVDNIAGQTSQGIPIEGYGVPLVTDTMEDILCNFGGALIFFFHYLLSKLTKTNLLISTMEKEFSVKHKLFKKKDEKLSEIEKKSKTDEEKNNFLSDK